MFDNEINVTWGSTDEGFVLANTLQLNMRNSYFLFGWSRRQMPMTFTIMHQMCCMKRHSTQSQWKPIISQPLQNGVAHPLCTADWLGFEAKNYSVTLIMLPDITWNLLTKIVSTTLLIETRGTRFVYYIVYTHWLKEIKCMQINWVVQLTHSR